MKTIFNLVLLLFLTFNSYAETFYFSYNKIKKETNDKTVGVINHRGVIEIDTDDDVVVILDKVYDVIHLKYEENTKGDRVFCTLRARTTKNIISIVIAMNKYGQIYKIIAKESNNFFYFE